MQATGKQAYTDLIHTIKITSLKLITDLVDAEEDKVLQSIHRTDGHHFMTGFTVHTRASTSRTNDPEFSTQHFDDTTNKLIVELHLEAAAVCEKMSNIHAYVTHCFMGSVWILDSVANRQMRHKTAWQLQFI